MSPQEIAPRWENIVAVVKAKSDDGDITLDTLQHAQKRLSNLIFEVDRDNIIGEMGSE